MRGRRFLALLSPPGIPLPLHAIDRARAAATALTPLVATNRLLLWSDHPHWIAHPEGHAILGDLFDRGSARPEQTLGEAAWSAITQSRGAMLIDRYWGSYVAFLSGESATSIVRAPFGDLGCFHVEANGVRLFSSDLALLEALGCRRIIDPGALARHIAHPEWRRSETCLVGIAELRGGDRLTVSADGAAQQCLWSPWTHVAPDRRIDDAAQAAHLVRSAVHYAVRARAAESDRLVLLLSGGLDSSIVASSLKGTSADVIGLNLVGDDAASDERHYAALAAQAAGIDLQTRRFDLARIDVRSSGAAHMPYPVHRCFTQAQDAIAADMAVEWGADRVIDGGGGDNVFFASRTVAILADCLATRGPNRSFWDAARVLGDLGQAGIWRLAWRAAQRAWFRSPAPRQAPTIDFLSDAARAIVRDTPAHPWFLPPPGILPGRAAHVALLVPAQNLVEAVNALAPQRAVSPLVSQPVVEACLRIPSWHWLAPSRDRAVARRAFEPDLPAAIVSRRSKGTPTGFVATIFDRHRPVIRDMLLGGRLAALGLIDTGKLAEALSLPGPVRGLRFVRLMELVDAEAWAAAQG